MYNEELKRATKSNAKTDIIICHMDLKFFGKLYISNKRMYDRTGKTKFMIRAVECLKKREDIKNILACAYIIYHKGENTDESNLQNV